MVDRRKLARGTAWLLLGSVLASGPATAHGAVPDGHGNLLPVLVFLGSVVLLGGSLVADHWDLVERSRADVGVLAGGLGIVLSIGLLWL